MLYFFYHKKKAKGWRLLSPFFTERFGFIPAGLLDKGQRLLRADNQYSTVVEVDLTPYELVAYNFEVADYHTYFVGEQRLWVHNACKLDKLSPGEFATESIPARGPERNFTKSERDQINEIGASSGCHTCGTKETGTKCGNYILDHQPPSSLNADNAAQKLYPHCTSCSASQGGQVTQAKRNQLQ